MVSLPQELVVGHPVIDHQHREIYRRTDELLDSSFLERDLEKLPAFADYLMDYVDVHFRDEEMFMGRLDFPGLVPHQHAHAAFRLKVVRLRSTLDSEGLGAAAYADVCRVVTDWFEGHINTLDREFAKFVRAHHGK
jgi:hemerythrin-like metal-binding protein